MSTPASISGLSGDAAAVQAVQDAVVAAITKDELELPTLPEVALAIRDAAQDENITAAKLAQVLSDDPGLTASIVKIANSPMFRAPKAIEDLQMAISRLGNEAIAGSEQRPASTLSDSKPMILLQD